MVFLVDEMESFLSKSPLKFNIKGWALTNKGFVDYLQESLQHQDVFLFLLKYCLKPGTKFFMVYSSKTYNSEDNPGSAYALDLSEPVLGTLLVDLYVDFQNYSKVLGYSDQWLSLSEFFEIIEKLICLSGAFSLGFNSYPLNEIEAKIYAEARNFEQWLFVISKTKIYFNYESKEDDGFTASRFADP